MRTTRSGHECSGEGAGEGSRGREALDRAAAELRWQQERILAGGAGGGAAAPSRRTNSRAVRTVRPVAHSSGSASSHGYAGESSRAYARTRGAGVVGVENQPPRALHRGAASASAPVADAECHWLRDELLELAALENELSTTMRPSELFT